MKIFIIVFVFIMLSLCGTVIFAMRKINEVEEDNNQLIDEVIEKMCDRYCKHPHNPKIGESALSMICDCCPLNELNKIRS